MTNSEKTEAGRRRQRQAAVPARAAEKTGAPIIAKAVTSATIVETSRIAPITGLHVISEAPGTGWEALAADDIATAGAGKGVVARNVMPAGGETSGTSMPREIGQLARSAKQLRSDTKAFASSLPAKVPAGKNHKIAELVSRPEGASTDELTAATGWQRHTVRAALTRLRRAGFGVELRTGADERRAYHHSGSEEASS